MALRIVADANQPLAAEGFADVGEVTVLPPAAITREALRDADALVCRSTVKVTPELLEGTAVRFVGTCTIGFDHVDREWLASRGIAFASAPGCNANSVGEWFVAAMLTWAVEKGVSLAGKTLGVVGAGHVGKIVAARAAALRMRVLVNDPPRARAEGATGFVALPELLGASDFVTVHVPLTREGPDATAGLAGAGFFAAMRPGAVFVNASRGAVVDESALQAALASGHLAGAMLDVFANEPRPDPGLLQKLFLATPHVAGYSFDGKVNGARQVHAALCRHFGLAAEWKPQVVMPELAVSEIVVESDAAFEVELLDAVSAVYDVRRDHRALLADPAAFARLRAEYPPRYEFFHTVVVAPYHRRDLREGFAGIGFARAEWDKG